MAKPSEKRRSGGPKALAVSLSDVTRKALRHRSLAERGLIVDWAIICGAETAALCHPAKLSFSRRDRRMDGLLALRVRAGQATRLQHMEPLLLERINGYFGYRAVEKRTQTANLHATILELLGLDHQLLSWPHNGRDERLTDVYEAKVIDELIA